MRRLLVVCGCLGLFAECCLEFEDTENDGGPMPDGIGVSTEEREDRIAQMIPVADTPAPALACPLLEPEIEGNGPVDAPISLTATDGTGLVLRKLKARAVIDGPLAFTELTIEFQNPENRTLEGRFEVVLPGGAAISRFAMRIGDKWQEAEVVEKQTARRAYEDFLHRNRDPALLEKSAGNRFAARVFPISPHEKKSFIISYSEELTDRCAPYRLLLNGLPTIDSLDVDIHLGNGRHAIRTERVFTPANDMTVALETTAAAAGLRFDRLAAARVTPPIAGEQDPIARLTVLFDTSFSRRPGFAAKVAKLGAIVQALLGESPEDFRLRVVCFDQTTEIVYEGAASGFGQTAQQAILDRSPLGASNLEMVLQELSRRTFEAERVVIFTDGIPTAGNRDEGEMRRDLAEARWAGVTRVDAVADDTARDDGMLTSLTRAGLQSDGVVVDGEMPAARIARRLQHAVLSDAVVRVPGAAWVWPDRVSGLQPGDSFIVYAALPANRPLHVVMSDIGYDRILPLRPTVRPLLERAWVRANIRRLEAMIGEDGAADDAVKAKITALSLAHRVLSDQTALLVLETEEDYRRFHIDRKALADILTVGKNGLRLLHRSDAVLSGKGNSATLIGDAIGDNYGFGGLGLSGTGRGEGGRGEGIGLGRIGTIGHGGGSGVSDRRTTSVPSIRAGSCMVTGSLAKDVVKRIIDRRKNELRSCYNHLLLTHPEAEGKVGVKFVIAAAGEVAAAQIEDSSIGDEAFQRCIESTISTWTFPQPSHAGIVIIRYPIQFSIRNRDEKEAPRVAAAPSPSGKDRFLTMIDSFIDVDLETQRAAAWDKEVAAVRPPKIESDLEIPLRAPQTRTVAQINPYREKSPVSDRPQEAPLPLPAAADTGITEDEKTPFERPQPENAYSGTFAAVLREIRGDRITAALDRARRWFEQTGGSVPAVIALGEALEASGDMTRAARAYGSLIDQFPNRAEMLRTAGERLERLDRHGLSLAIDAYKTAVRERPDHPSGYRLKAFALLKSGHPDAAFEAIRQGLLQKYPEGRFGGVQRILREDLALIGAVWMAAQPEKQDGVLEALRPFHLRPETRPSTRFVLSWESDANDVDLHIFDGKHNHVSFQNHELATGGSLYADVTTGFGPECVAIRGNPRAYPYTIQAHYFSRGPMGIGMGKLQILRHDGKGNIAFSERPFVIQKDNAYVNLGTLRKGDLSARGPV